MYFCINNMGNMNRKIANKELDRLTHDEFINSDKTPIGIVLDNIRSQHNIGSVFRTSDAFRIESIMLCGISATPPNNEIHKTALGSELTVAWKHFTNTADAIMYLKNEGYIILSLEQTEKKIFLHEFQPEKNKKYALVFGNEVKGVAQSIIDISDSCIEIPQLGTKHSLNVSVSVGIVVWDFVSKMKQL